MEPLPIAEFVEIMEWWIFSYGGDCFPYFGV